MGSGPALKYISGSSFHGLVDGLLGDHKVIGTVDKDGFPAFSHITSFEELTLSERPTHLSGKEFFFPQKETLLEFDLVKNTHRPVTESQKQVIIGMHPCDIAALELMDRVFASGTPDPNYLKRRSETIIIGSGCMPDRFCFCESLGTSEARSGFDLFLHRLKSGFLLSVGSKEGEELLTKYKVATREPRPAEIRQYEAINKKRSDLFVTRLEAPPGELPGIYERSGESPVWERIGAICYGCGSCNHVCPTCYCFDVKDELRPDLTGGKRVRVWDGCTLDDFAKVAGGHNFRKTRAERLRHRFNRKFRYLSAKFNSLFCVGCGRCSRACLVRINIASVTNELIREDRKK